ncbi:NlpC/P60 family protein [Georhizobium sp. MAB10]|uniref:NlpC/P60 family protein n=1 Tax=Georhizobium sp. MAB10 TaxID=3028319 RepID=UPI003855C5B0
MTTPVITRQRILDEARRWLGTPYRHQGSSLGIGCDCLGLVCGVWRAVYGCEPEAPGPYAADWADGNQSERLLEAAERHCGAAFGLAAAQPGDLIVLRWRPDQPARHIGILSGPDHFIHAYEQASVVQSALVPSWRRRVAAAYCFPGITD